MADVLSDVDLRKAFTELQGKMVETKKKLMKGDYEIDLHRSNVKRANLTKAELTPLPPDTATYQTVGRMFLKQSLQESISQLNDKVKTSEEKIAAIQSQKLYLEKSLRESETNIREMVQTRQANR